MATARRYIIGIDEVGRGPLAGPVAIGAVALTSAMLRSFRPIKDSKQLSRKERERWCAKILRSEGRELRVAVSFVQARVIDNIGIAPAIRLAVARSLQKLKVSPSACAILLDGGLRAPERFHRQKTIIKGDEKETVIAMASVVAKVLRDRRMFRLHKKFPRYGFDRHVGYGTKLHIAAIRRCGPTKEHRKTFLRRVIQ